VGSIQVHSFCNVWLRIDYGCLTFLIADAHGKGSLQVKLPATGEWIPADPVPGCFVCNIGDMMQVGSKVHTDMTYRRSGRTNSTLQHCIESYTSHLDIVFQFHSSSNPTSTPSYPP
jgi:2OG-Fe(II) oxygenase superfamily